MQINEKYNKKLLVEGNDDQHVVWALCEKFNVSQSFDVIDCNSINNVYKEISTRSKLLDTVTIGIIIDADTEIKNQLKVLKSLLSKYEFEIPLNLPPDGFIATNEKGKKVGIWIMPNNQMNGMLEDFITFLVPKDDKLLSTVNETLEKIEQNNHAKYKPIHKSKATIHTWLAWQEDPGTPMGWSITKRYLTTDEETCLKLIDWLNRLFN